MDNVRTHLSGVKPRKRKGPGRPRSVKPLPPGPAVGPIEKDVPIPRARNNGGLRNLMKDLQPGDSFVTSMSGNACRLMGLKLGFATRYRRETASTIRVWRYKPEEE